MKLKSMRLVKHCAIIVLVISFTWSCQQSDDKAKDNTEYESASSSEQEQAPNQTQQIPDKAQSQGSEVSDKELKQFVSTSQHIQVINQQVQQEMVAAVEKEGLQAQRYSEIQQVQQDPNQETNATDEELKQYESATQKLQKIQIQAQQQIKKKLKDNGLSERRYQEINMALQSNPELQEKFRSIQQQSN